MKVQKTPHIPLGWMLAGAAIGALLIAAAFLPVTGAHAAVTPSQPPTGQTSRNNQMGSDTCLGCHSQADMKTALPSGEELLLTIDAEKFKASVHGNYGLECNACHISIDEFPHPELTSATHQEFSFEATQSCEKCHADQYSAVKDSIHMQAYEEGNKLAPACTDCHNPHTQSKLVDQNDVTLVEARVNIPITCAKCHNEIYEQYKGSVHGAALLEEGNNDTPTCIDCHSVHNVSAVDNAFRLRSPGVCGECHANKELMDKYGLSSEVNDTYIADFHGTTVTIFEKTAPDQKTNTPVCIDCHGVHNMTRSDDPNNGLHVKENLLRTCQKCHPDAKDNFPASWMSHYSATPEKAPLVYYVNLFYKILIPLIIGFMILYVISDFIRRLIEKRKGA